MIVDVPQTKYKIKITKKEKETIEDCINVLDDIVSALIKHDCNSLNTEDKECSEIITEGEIAEIMSALVSIKKASTMGLI